MRLQLRFFFSEKFNASTCGEFVMLHLLIFNIRILITFAKNMNNTPVQYGFLLAALTLAAFFCCSCNSSCLVALKK
jgi:hypothetical protein